MYARIASAVLALGMFASLGANYRTPHFMITAPSPELAKAVGDAAERYRRDLAIEWLGQELPRWIDPCPILVQPAQGAGGETSFMFQQGMPYSWQMRVQGTPERILDSVLPHEITHTIFATHFGRPLPRWADEGGCTTVEHDSEKNKQDKLLIQFLTTNRGIPFNQMFAMKDYPPDILPLYSQGFSLAKFLIAQGGKRKYIQYVGEGMDRNNWTVATKRHYGYDSLGDLQVMWLEWIKRGAPNPLPQDLVRLEQPAQPGSGIMLAASQGEMVPPQQIATSDPTMTNLLQGKATNANGAGPNGYFRNELAAKTAPTPAPPTTFTATQADGNSYYQRQRDARPTAETPGLPAIAAIQPSGERSVLTPTDPAPAPGITERQVLLEWRRETQQAQNLQDWSRTLPNPIRR